jgi:hypothetical protein
LKTSSELAKKEAEDLLCSVYGDYSFYNTAALKNTTYDYTALSQTFRTYKFNFCQYVSEPCGWTNDTDTYAYSYPGTSLLTVEGSCQILSSDESEYHSYEYLLKNGAQSNVTADRHLVIKRTGGQQCGTNHDQSSSITFEILCNENITAQPTRFNVSDADYCNPVISFTHKAGCPEANLDTISIFFEKYPWVIAIFLLIVGPVITFFGRRFVPYVIAIIGGLVSSVIALCLCSAMGMLDYIDPTSNTEASVFWVVLAFFLSLGAGVLVGWLLKKFLVIGLLIIAFVGGFLTGGLLYNLVFIGWAKSTVLLAILTFGLGAAAVVGAFFVRAAIIIVVTSLIGSYFTIRGISLFAGGFPSEITLY